MASQNQYPYSAVSKQPNGLLPGPNTGAPYWSHSIPGQRMEPNGSKPPPGAAVPVPMGAETPFHSMPAQQGVTPAANSSNAPAPAGRDSRATNGHGAGPTQSADKSDTASVHSTEEGSVANSPRPINFNAPYGEYLGGPQPMPGGQQQMYPGGGPMHGMWSMNQPRMMPHQHPGVPQGQQVRQQAHAKMGQQMPNMYQQSMMQRGGMMPQQMVGGMYGQPRPRGAPFDYYRGAPPNPQHQMQDWRQHMGMHNPASGPQQQQQQRYDSTFIYPQFGRSSNAPLPSLSHLSQLPAVPQVSAESRGRPRDPVLDMHNRPAAGANPVEIAEDVSLIRESTLGGGQK